MKRERQGGKEATKGTKGVEGPGGVMRGGRGAEGSSSEAHQGRNKSVGRPLRPDAAPGPRDGQTVSTRAQGSSLLQRPCGPGAGAGEAGRFSCQSPTSHPPAPPPQRPEKVQAPSRWASCRPPMPPSAGVLLTQQHLGCPEHRRREAARLHGDCVKVSAGSHPDLQHETSQIRKEEARLTVLSPLQL